MATTLDPRLRVYFNNKQHYDAIRADEQKNGIFSEEEWKALADGLVGDKTFEYAPKTPSVDPGGFANIPQYLKAVGSGFKQINEMSQGQRDILLNKANSPGDALGIGSGRTTDLNKIAASIFEPQRYNEMRDAAIATEQPIPGWAIAELLSGKDPQEMPGILNSLFKGEGSASDLYRTWGGIGARSLLDMVASSQLGPLGIPAMELTGLPNLAHTIIDPRAGEDNALGGPIPAVIAGELLGGAGNVVNRAGKKIGGSIVNKVRGSFSDVFGAGRYTPKPEISYGEGAQTRIPTDYYMKLFGEGASTPLPEGYFGKGNLPSRFNHDLSPKFQEDLDWLAEQANRGSYLREMSARGTPIDYIPTQRSVRGPGKVAGQIADDETKKVITTSGRFGIRPGAQTPIGQRRFGGWPQESPMDVWAKENPLPGPRRVPEATPGQALPEPSQVPTTTDVIRELESIPPVAPEVPPVAPQAPSRPIVEPPPPVVEPAPVQVQTPRARGGRPKNPPEPAKVTPDVADQALKMKKMAEAEEAWPAALKRIEAARPEGSKPLHTDEIVSLKNAFIETFMESRPGTQKAMKASGSAGGTARAEKVGQKVSGKKVGAKSRGPSAETPSDDPRWDDLSGEEALLDKYSKMYDEATTQEQKGKIYDTIRMIEKRIDEILKDLKLNPKGKAK